MLPTLEGCDIIHCVIDERDISDDALKVIAAQLDGKERYDKRCSPAIEAQFKFADGRMCFARYYKKL